MSDLVDPVFAVLALARQGVLVSPTPADGADVPGVFWGQAVGEGEDHGEGIVIPPEGPITRLPQDVHRVHDPLLQMLRKRSSMFPGAFCPGG